MPVDNRYRPPTKVVTTSIPFKTLVVRADPNFERETRREVFYDFSNGRKFIEDNAKQGPYAT